MTKILTKMDLVNNKIVNLGIVSVNTDVAHFGKTGGGTG